MSLPIHFRSLYNSWNTEANRDFLISQVQDGKYDEGFVEENLAKKNFEFLPSRLEHPNITSEQLLALRSAVLKIHSAQVVGARNLPSESSDKVELSFNGQFFSNVLEIFPMSLYEASLPGVWNYLTWYLLLDIAVAMYPPGTVRQRHQRFDFNRSRHAFARWWFRAYMSSFSEKLLPGQLLESDWELIYERQSLCWSPQVANAVARVIVHYKYDGVLDTAGLVDGFEQEWIKRVLRLTSQSIFEVHSEDELFVIFLDLFEGLKKK